MRPGVPDPEGTVADAAAAGDAVAGVAAAGVAAAAAVVGADAGLPERQRGEPDAWIPPVAGVTDGLRLRFDGRESIVKICITASGEGLDAAVDPRFGRAAYFVLVDTDTLEARTQSNEAVDAGHGAGVQAAQTVVASGARAVVSGHCGPKAFQVLDAAGIEVYTGASGSVRDTVQAFLDGRLSRAEGADVPQGGAG